MSPAPLAAPNAQRLRLQAGNEPPLPAPGTPFANGRSQGPSAGVAGWQDQALSFPVVRLCLLSRRPFPAVPLLEKRSSGEPARPGSFHRLSRQRGKRQEKLRVETHTSSSRGLAGLKSRFRWERNFVLSCNVVTSGITGKELIWRHRTIQKTAVRSGCCRRTKTIAERFNNGDETASLALMEKQRTFV